MQKTHAIMLTLVLFMLSNLPARAGDQEKNEGSGWALDARLGTMGVGADLSRSLVPRLLNLRVGASFFSYSEEFDQDGITYAGELKLGAIPIGLDLFPFKNWLRAGVGVLVNLNEVTGMAKPSGGTLTIGDNTYSTQDFGQLDGKVKFNRVAPYIGFGFNNPIKKKGHWGFFTDLGIFYHGAPALKLTPSKAVSAALQADIDKEVQSVNRDIEDFTIFPVIQLGISYKF